MINTLLDASIKTMIGQLPAIINYNNDMIEQEFDTIVDTSTQKMKLDVQCDHVKSVTGQFTNLIVNNVQLDASSLEQYNVLYNQIQDISARISGVSYVSEAVYAAPVNEKKTSVTYNDGIDMSLFFNETDFRKAVITGLTLNDLFYQKPYVLVDGIRIPLQLTTEALNAGTGFVIYYDHILKQWNSVERLMVSLEDGEDGNSIVAVSAPVSKKIKMMN